MDEQASYLVVESVSIRRRLPLCGMKIDDDVAQENVLFTGQLPPVEVHWEGENIRSLLYTTVEVIQALHPAVVHKQYPEFGLLKVE